MVTIGGITYQHIDKGLNFIIPNYVLLEEFNYFKTAVPRKYSLVTNRSKIIRFFQQNTFYAREKEMWEDDGVKAKIIANRLEYLGKTPETLTTYDVITGFKKSGMHYGYSGFNPLLVKKFCVDNGVRSLYDPCGGWGHRLLGCLTLDSYIYNDMSRTTCENVKDIISYFDIKNARVYNNDARTFVPDEEFDAVFTCPPYYNLEKYECKNFSSRVEFDEFMESIYGMFAQSKASVMGIVMREDLMPECMKPTESITLKVQSPTHLVKGEGKKPSEKLYIYRK